MISYYKGHGRVFWTDLFFAALSACIALVIPLVLRYVTKTLVYDEPAVILKKTVWIAGLLVVLLLVDMYARYYISSAGHVMGAKIEYTMRAEIFSHLQKLSFSFYDDVKVGKLMSRITTDLFDVTELMHHGPENLILCSFSMIGALIILFGINPILALATAIVLPFMIFFTIKMNRNMKAAFKRNREKIADINGQIEDNLAGIRVVKSFANEEIERNKFKTGNDGFLAAKKNSYHYMGMFHTGVSTFINLMSAVVVITGTVLIAKARMDATDLVTFMLYIGILTKPVDNLISFTEQFQNGYTGFERFREIMEIEPDIADSPDAEELSNVKGNIKFDNVSFAYNKEGERVLNHINLEIPAGSYFALVGSSGAGKTTLCSLIPRFYDVDKGRVCIDGKDVREVTLKSLRDRIGIVQQDVYLFAGTVYENIMYGRPDATRDEVVEAAKNANAHEFIMNLPNGYDTDIGQRGVKLSGGQKQRLSIARVFLKNPPILIFDEATSSLDNESERVVQESLEKLAENRTTLVIAHRLSTIRNAQRILVLNEDGIAEEGTHEELMARGGLYEKLYDMQFKE